MNFANLFHQCAQRLLHFGEGRKVALAEQPRIYPWGHYVGSLIDAILKVHLGGPRSGEMVLYLKAKTT